MRNILLVCASVFLFASCSELLGYGVVLWSMDEHGLGDGEIVPVYLKSTISQVYVIALPQTGEKVEVPLWQITAPVSKSKAVAERAKYAEYQHQYAITLLDGLPIRASAVNTARQVYRLRKDEIVKVLYKGEGQPVMAGETPMEGDWLRILTNDGTEGWCFSHNLRVFDIREQSAELTETVHAEIAQAELEEVLKKNWRPEAYLAMLLNKTVDLSQMNADYGFTLDFAQKTGRLRLANADISFSYTDITKGRERSYILAGSPISLNIPDNNLLIVSAANSRGIPVSYNFIPIDEPITDIINMEKERRTQLFEDLLAFGPNFVSENYGALQFSSGNTVFWTENQMLIPSVISAQSSPRGTVEFKYFISDRLKAIFDGVVTINLEGSEKENNFFYAIRDDGIQLEDANSVSLQGSVFTGRAASPTVMFFAKE